MSWLNTSLQGLNSLKGQLASLGDALQEGAGAGAGSDQHQIAELKKLNEELQKELQSERLSRQNGIANVEKESSWVWDPPSHTSHHHSRYPAHPDGDPERESKEEQYKKQIQAMQDEISNLKKSIPGKGDEKWTDGNKDVEEEMKRLKEENVNLTANLEDLDNQHQVAMERLLSLKKELQKNFEILKQEHEDLKSANDDFSKEVSELKSKIVEKDREIINALDKVQTSKTEYETLHHKYQNLERVHSMLRETAEKFQEENQELHEDVFKLQEEISKLQDDDLHTKHTDVSDMIPRNKYEELLKELMLLQENRRSADSLHLDETNIDDNAKSVIENLKRDISDLKHKLTHKSDLDRVDVSTSHTHLINTDKLLQIYNKYVTFDLPVDYVGEMTSTGDSNFIFKIENALKTLNSFKKQIEVLEQKLSEENLNQSNLQTQIEDLTSEKYLLTSDLSECEHELSEMKINNDFLLTEITTLKNASKLEPIRESHEDNIVKLESELADCSKQNKTFETEIRQIEKQLSEVRDEKLLLQSDLNDLRDKYNHMLLELDSYKTKALAVHQLEIDTQVDHNEKLRKALEEIEELKTKLHTTASKNEQLNIEHSIIENEKVLLTSNLNDMKSELDEKENSHKELKAMKMALEHKLHSLEDQLDGLIKDKSSIEYDRQNLLEKLKILSGKTQNVALNKERYNKLKWVEEDADKYISEIETNLNQYKKTETELRAKMEELESYKSDSSKFSKQIQLLTKENSAMQKNIDALSQDMHTSKNHEKELIDKIAKIKTNINENSNTTQLQEEIALLKSKLEDNKTSTKELEGLREDKHHLLELKSYLENELASTDERLTTFDAKFEQLLADLKAKNIEIEHLNSSLNANYANVTSLNETISSLQSAIEFKDKELNRLNETIKELNVTIQESHRVNKIYVSDTQNNSDKLKNYEILEHKIVELNNNLSSKESELNEAKLKLDECDKACVENASLLENLTKEKTELINFITVKHNENIQYHNEIQRLNQLVLEHAAEHKKVIDELDTLRNKTAQNCMECEKLKISLSEKDEKLMQLNQSMTSTYNAKGDLANATDLIRKLTNKCEDLDKNLTIQLDAVRKLTTENSQLSEREQAQARELERLREHLIEIEETYTQELTQEQQKLAECQSKLHNLEDRARQSNTVYTSNSIRANQEVETLRTQIRLLEKQREEAQVRLSEAEHSDQKSKAALTSLQAVLQQFQSDKEHDIATATEKLHNRLEGQKKINEDLKTEIGRLNTKLEESMNGLKAAARLGDQLEAKTAMLIDYKEQVRALQESVRASEERYQSIQQQRDRVDKGLVKNLLINYVQAAVGARQDKLQILRILSSVLDFDQAECERIGLARLPAGGARGPDSLAREFVKFLEKESRPTAPLPNMMGLTTQGQGQGQAQASSRSTTPLSRKNSGLGPQPSPQDLYGHRRTASTSSSNLLFQNIQAVETSSQISLESNPQPARAIDTGVNQTRNSEGAILKNVLKDI